MLLPVVIASATLGRLAMIAAMARLDPVPGRASLAQSLGPNMRRTVFAWACLASLPGIAWLGVCDPPLVLISIGLTAIFLACFAAYVRARIGGLTGDCLGALCYFVQILVLLCAAARWRPL
jgi:adenosylcobinamide-GDP ribazoletransferase